MIILKFLEHRFVFTNGLLVTNLIQLEDTTQTNKLFTTTSNEPKTINNKGGV